MISRNFTEMFIMYVFVHSNKVTCYIYKICNILCQQQVQSEFRLMHHFAFEDKG